jgi:uncharacterized protein DUF2867
MAVLVKPNGLLGTAYMAAIRPFRHLIVYPAMMREGEWGWAGARRRSETGARVAQMVDSKSRIGGSGARGHKRAPAPTMNRDTAIGLLDRLHKAPHDFYVGGSGAVLALNITSTLPAGDELGYIGMRTWSHDSL